MKKMTVQQNQLLQPKYRPDIDGLRAIAVLAVVIFHAFPNYLKGGFIGVDVFFVISGYLISTIIFERLHKDTFSFTEFYARRVMRIFPALILVLIACLAIGFLVLLADEYKQLGKHVVTSAGFLSNFIFWSESGYFDNSVDSKPLLHLWSLGIEEQFYIIWPMLVWVVWKKKYSFLIVITLLSTGSFVLNIKGINHDIIAIFYSPLTRFWELLLGALLAWLTLYKNIENKLISIYGNNLPNLISLIGLSFLFYGFFIISAETIFPGWWALIPVLGSILIITAGPRSWFNHKILSSRLAVWFGLISYPLYLWHWPLLSFARIISGETPTSWIRVSVVVISIFLAWITYILIERPFKLLNYNIKYMALKFVIVMFFLGIIGAVIYLGDGFTFRNSITGNNYSVSSIERLTADDPISHKKCMRMYNLSDNIRYCSVSTDYRPNIAIIGDSHGAALYKGLSEKLLTENKGLLNLGGRLFLDVATYPLGNEFEIEVYKGGIRATTFVAHEKSIDTVILVSMGPFYLYDGWLFFLISDPDVTDKMKVFEIGMRKTLDSLKNKKQVIFVIDNPEMDFDPRLCAPRPFSFSKSSITDCSISRENYESRSNEYRSLVLRVLLDYPQVQLFDTAAYLCDDLRCFAKHNNDVLYVDSHHLSKKGARLLSNELYKVINGANSKILTH